MAVLKSEVNSELKKQFQELCEKKGRTEAALVRIAVQNLIKAEKERKVIKVTINQHLL
jgi:predicted transcriptional regulator